MTDMTRRLLYDVGVNAAVFFSVVWIVCRALPGIMVSGSDQLAGMGYWSKWIKHRTDGMDWFKGFRR